MTEEAAQVTYEGFCPQCGEEQKVMQTVPWQEDACMACGASVEDT